MILCGGLLDTADLRRRLPLPTGWPGRIRSTILQTISLVQFSITHARSVASNSLSAQVRLKQRNDRLRQEVALLREELTIKDARMQQISAQRRPHYRPIDRLAILELRAARGWSLPQTARRLLVTPATVCNWMQRLDEEGPGPQPHLECRFDYDSHRPRLLDSLAALRPAPVLAFLLVVGRRRRSLLATN